MPKNHEISLALVGNVFESECRDLMKKHGINEDDAFLNECSDCRGLPCLVECPWREASK